MSSVDSSPSAPSSSSSSFISLNHFNSAKIKLDELFLQFLLSEGTENIINLITDSINNDDSGSEVDPNTSDDMKSINSSSGNNGIQTSILLKKSPKKRTQSEMLNSKTNNKAQSDDLMAVDELGKLSISISPSASIADDADTSSSTVVSTEPSSSKDSAPSSNQSSSKEEIPVVNNDHTAMRRKPNFDKIPIFYVPGKKPQHLVHLSDEDKLVKRLPEIEAFFKPFPGGIPVEKFVHVTKRLCGIPSFFNLPLCRRINERFGDSDSGIPGPRTVGRAGRQPSGVKIKLKCFLKFWQAEIEPYDRIERFFRIIKKHDAEYIYKDDFLPFLQELLHFHPGLDFLETHEEFQRKYALTVITRIFYKVNTSRSGKLSLAEVRKSNLFNACMHVDEETDINKVLEYFSYEHFYVIYCKFFELDLDKDSKLMKSDLLKYGDHTLSEAIVDRVFQVGYRVFTDGLVGGFESIGMTYPDFIFFMLSEEDKTTECALSYWFRCCDLDGDGYLSPEEMRYFYRNQIHRITSLGQESINFSDVLCQMLDMVSPADTSRITLQDLIRPDKKLNSGSLFDVLFNLNKFMRFESRDPFQEKIRREDVYHSDWDRFAHAEYNRLAQEEEDTYDTSMDLDLQQMTMGMEGDGDIGPAMPGGVDSMGNWSLNDEEEESEDEDDERLLGNRLVNKGGSGLYRK